MTDGRHGRRRRDGARRRDAPAAHPPDHAAAATNPRARGATPKGSAASTWPPAVWAAFGALALLPLWWKSLGPTLGMPVADDYIFLSRLAFHHPFDLFGPMGAAYYWRPLSRQAYYLLVGPWLERAPWLAALLAAVLLLALYIVLYRLARRGPARGYSDGGWAWAPAVAAGIACFPLLAEPARVLLAWPSAAQHLLGALFAALALERAFAGGLALAALAALLALLSNEAAFVVLPALPLVAWWRAGQAPAAGSGARAAARRAALRWGAAAAVVAAVWAAGYLVARAHGAGLPTGRGMPTRWDLLPAVVGTALTAQLGLESLPEAARDAFWVAFAALGLAGIAASFAPAARRRLAPAAPLLLGGLAWFVAGVVPLVFVLPDWNGWRATVAGLGLAVTLGGWLGLAAPALAGALVALRLLALLLSPGPPATVSVAAPATPSSFSLERLVRLQRTVESTRRALARGPAPPRGGVIRYWDIPRLAEVGFNGRTAPRLWYRDSTLDWQPFGGIAGIEQRADVVVDFQGGKPWPAVRLSADALRFYRGAYQALLVRHGAEADSLLALALAAQPPEAEGFVGALLQSRAGIAYNRGDYARADSLLRAGHALGGDNAGYFALLARLDLVRGDRDAAVRDALRSLQLDPNQPDGLAVARSLGVVPGTQQPAPAPAP